MKKITAKAKEKKSAGAEEKKHVAAKEEKAAATHAVQEEKHGEQAELNIGMVGHVDHGKCIAADELLLLNSELCEAGELVERLEKTTKPKKISGSELVYPARVGAFVLAQDFSLVSANANVFVQNYNGPMINILTKRGKEIKVSPKHPLLVHNGFELEWKEAQAIKTGDCVVALRTIPGQDFAKDYGNEWESVLSDGFWIVGQEEFNKLAKKTNNFSELGKAKEADYNCARILKQLSISHLEKALQIPAGALATAIKKNSLTEKQKLLLQGFFSKQKFAEPKGTILNLKAKSHCFCKIDTTLDAFGTEILRLLAFIIAEGHVRNNSIQIAQSQNELLEEIQKTSKKYFGTCFTYAGRFDYRINNKALASYLQARYGIRTGTARKTGIPNWVFALPKQKLAAFLNMFFSAEANINKNSGQFLLVQANKRSIEIVSYCLKKFDIAHSTHKIFKAATNGTKQKREYFQLIISGITNLKRLSELIGFSLPEKQAILEKIAQKSRKGKCADEMIPFKKQQMMEIAGLLGWKKHVLSPKPKNLESQEWYWAYNDCYAKNAISPKNLETFIGACHKRLDELKLIKEKTNQNKFEETLSELGSSWQELAKKLKITPKILFSWRKKKSIAEQEKIRNALSKEIEIRVLRAKETIERIEKNYSLKLEFDFVKNTETEEYCGKIIDLQVPGYQNFVAGNGALICHNTSLTKALTGKWTDTHSEELKRGISIRLGYADTTFYKCEHCKGSEAFTTKEVCANCGKNAKKLRRVSFVDAPGHETLMTTMLSGAALMNGAVLVIAANETVPQPRTVEHLTALKAAGITHIVVAQNKIDLVEKKQAIENAKQISGFLKQNGFENAPIIPTAANLGTNIDLLIEAIEENIPTPKYDSEKPLKMSVARSFDVNKPGILPERLVGAVIGGSITQGIAKIGDEIEISPGVDEKPLRTTIASLSTETGFLEKARPGGLVGIGTLLDPELSKNDNLKGQVIGKPGTLPQPVKRIAMKYFLLNRLVEEASNEIKLNDVIVLTIGTNTIVGTIVKATKETLEIVLKSAAIVEQGQKVAVSKKQKNGWRLAAYGTAA